MFDVPDSAENAEYFGRPQIHRTERCAYPQVRMVALAECGTHAIIAAALGPFKVSESVLARQLFGHLGAGDLLLADRGFAGVGLWRAACAGIETALDELKTHQRGPAQVLRSRSPEGVEQEVWGHLLVHYAIRTLMHDTADHARVDADRLSFTRSIRLARRQVTAQAGFSPDHLAAALAEGLREIARHLLPTRRGRTNPRVVKRKMSSFKVKRDKAPQTRPHDNRIRPMP
ncbi:hypothetical protein [Nocardia wallacei]|uniref:hypothetical protein n=1 Tax=Nocardia wallacei TaxID=480035 RepID=UPI003CC80D75